MNAPASPPDKPLASLRISRKGDKIRLSATLNKDGGNDTLSRTVALDPAKIATDLESALTHFVGTIRSHLGAHVGVEPKTSGQPTTDKPGAGGSSSA